MSTKDKVTQCVWAFIIVVLIMFGLWAVNAVACAPYAKADETSFIDALGTNDLVAFSGDINQFVIAGYKVCNAKGLGLPDRAVIEILDISPLYNFDYTGAEEMYYLAVEHLCPWYLDKAVIA